MKKRQCPNPSGTGKAFEAFKAMLQLERRENAKLRWQLKGYQDGAVRRRYRVALEANVRTRVELGRKLYDAQDEVARLENCLRKSHQNEARLLNERDAARAEIRRMLGEVVRHVV